MQEIENKLKTPRRRRPRRRVSFQSLPIDQQKIPQFNWWVRRTPEEERKIVVAKAVMTLASIGYGEAIKEIRRSRRGDTFVDELLKEFWAAVFEGVKERIEYARDQL